MRLLFNFIIFLSFNSFAFEELHSEFRYEIPSFEATNSEVTEYEFYSMAPLILSLFAEEMQAENKIVAPNLLWETGYFSAWASYEKGYYYTNFWGGLARVPRMTKIAWSFVVCHELGHILGGTPRINLSKLKWSTAEGQADHFAYNICMPRFLKAYPFEFNIDDVVSKSCEKLGEENKYLCSGILQAGLDYVKVKEFIDNKVHHIKIDTPAAPVKTTVVNGYPSLQCRLDIAYQASQCLDKDCSRSKCWYHSN